MRSDGAPTLGGVSVRLRLARRMRGMTLKGLATAVGCSESMLSKIENGRTSPSLPLLHRLVEALGTDIGWVFEENDGDAGIVFRSGDRPMIVLDPLRRGEGISLERVVPCAPGHLPRCDVHHIEAGGESAGPIQHVGEEFGYVLRGRVDLVLDGRTFHFGEGDSFVFASNLPHAYRNAGDGPASIFRVNTPPPL